MFTSLLVHYSRHVMVYLGGFLARAEIRTAAIATKFQPEGRAENSSWAEIRHVTRPLVNYARSSRLL